MTLDYGNFSLLYIINRTRAKVMELDMLLDFGCLGASGVAGARFQVRVI